MNLADRLGLDDDLAELFAMIVEALDIVYLQWQIAEAKKRQEAGL